MPFDSNKNSSTRGEWTVTKVEMHERMDRLFMLAEAVVEDADRTEFVIHKDKLGVWWLNVNACLNGDSSSTSLAWNADKSLVTAIDLVEEKLEERARTMLNQLTSASRKLDAVLQHSEEPKP